MKTDEITIRVDADSARAFRSASEQDRQKLEVLLGLRLRESLSDQGSLLEIMDEISREAAANGLTPEILRSLLDDN